MRIISNTLDFHIEKKTAVAIGKFDGIHLGHQRLLEEIKKKKKDGLLTVIFTFDPSPQTFFGGMKSQLTTKEEKRKLFEQMGVDVLFEFPLTKETAATEPEDFIREYLVKKLNAGFIAAGKDLSFGNRGKGDCKLLCEKAKEYDYEVTLIDKVCLHDQEISSTLVRTVVQNGDMEEATSLLGQPYALRGIVEPGKQLGRTIDFPTINIFPHKDKILPPNGVYAVNVYHSYGVNHGICNIGVRPTISNSEKVSVETFLFDFSKDLYGQEIVVEFLTHTRPEFKFDGVKELKAQLEKDKTALEAYFKNNVDKVTDIVHNGKVIYVTKM